MPTTISPLDVVSGPPFIQRRILQPAGPQPPWAANTPGVIYSGHWTDASVAGGWAKQSPNQYATIDFAAFGTALDIMACVRAGASITVNVSVDLGAFAAMALPTITNTYQKLNVFNGLTDSLHSVTIRVFGSNSGQWCLNFANAFFTTSPSGQGAITNSALFPAGINIYNVADLFGLQGIEGNWWELRAITFGFGYGQPSCIEGFNEDEVVRFRGNPTAIRVFVFDNGASFTVYQDGVRVGAVVKATAANTNPPITANFMGWVQLVSGLDGAAHDYQIVGCAADTPIIAQIMTVGGSIDFTNVYARRGVMGFVGDSITQATTTTPDSTTGWAYKLSQLKNYACQNGGTGSTYMMTSTANASLLPGANAFYTDAIVWNMHSSNLSYLFYLIGFNDINSATPPQLETFLAAYTAMLISGRRAVGPTCQMIVMGILPTNSANAIPNRTKYNNMIQAAVAALADANCIYFSTDLLWGTGGLPPTSGQITSNTSDGIHPTAAGYDALVSYITANLSIPTWTAPTGTAGLLLNPGMEGGMRG